MENIEGFDFWVFSGGYLIVMAHVKMMGTAQEEFEATMTTNHNQGLLHWVNTKYIKEYIGDADGIMYIFQKPEA